jgi:hypothetical protein
VRHSLVEEFIVEDAGLGPAGCKTFAQSVNSKTTQINLAGNLITGSVRGEAIDAHTHYDLDLSGLEELQLKMQRKEDLEHPSELAAIDFTDCFLGMKAMRMVARMIENASKVGMSLTYLDLSGCQISEHGMLPGGGSTAADLAAAVGASITLTTLRLDSTGVPGYPRTYELCVNDACIDLSYMNMGEADLNMVVAWLEGPGSNHSKATWASFAGNALTESEQQPQEREKFLRLAEKSPMLAKLRAAEASAADASHRPGLALSVWRAIERKMNRTLQRTDLTQCKRLDLSGCYFAPEGVGRLAVILKDIPRLEDLSLRGSTLVATDSASSGNGHATAAAAAGRRGGAHAAGGGGRGGRRRGGGEHPSADPSMAGWIDLCQSVGSRLRRWDLSSCGLTAPSMQVLAEELDWHTATCVHRRIIRPPHITHCARTTIAAAANTGAIGRPRPATALQLMSNPD